MHFVYFVRILRFKKKEKQTWGILCQTLKKRNLLQLGKEGGGNWGRKVSI
jgi:hypothetical protein